MEAPWTSQWRGRQKSESAVRAGQIHVGAAGGEELWIGGGGQKGAVTWRPEDNQECGTLGHHADQLLKDGMIADARA